MQADIDRLEREVELQDGKILAMESRLEVVLSGRHGFMNDASARVNFLCQENRDCRRLYSALRVPQ
jgi:hypothetical protein